MFRTDLRSNRTRHAMLLTETSAIAKIQIEALPASGFRPGIQPTCLVSVNSARGPSASARPLPLRRRIIIHHGPPRRAFEVVILSVLSDHKNAPSPSKPSASGTK
jgi:hypothetical protein